MAELTKLEDKHGRGRRGLVCHVEILGTLARTVRDGAVIELADWALPIPERHLASVREGGVSLAAKEDPEEPA